ncbi:uncharacterized protein LOC121689684 [Alosa sapidissima]|uniref:uncharacterized protein LOC121689684 n=1 Tax=Alosa sapidissima TaxID=34773 RepID=UPI001C0857EF|nr:uncharacterized protein LOC121689684 [Alosa sapidissima]
MGLFVLSAKTPDLLFHVLLLLATAKSLHAGVNTTTGPTATTPTEGNSITIKTTTATIKPFSGRASTPNDTAPPQVTQANSTHNESHFSDIPSTTKHTDNTSDLTNITSPSSKTTTDTTVSTVVSSGTTETTVAAAAAAEPGGGGAVILIFLLLAIIVLGVLLYYLRKKSRSYSFDLSTPFNDQASDNTPLKPTEMETFQPKDTETPATLPSVVIESAENKPDSPIANGSVEGPGDPVITLDNGSIKSDPSECGSQTECLPRDSTDVDVEQQPGNENNNNFTVGTKATAGLKSGEVNFTEISLN